MRIAHLADLHLGRVFHGASLIDDQRHALAAVTEVLRERRVEVLLIAGDLYDRALPGREAVRLLDEFLRTVNEDLRVPVIAIAGNHDSAEHLGFGAWLFSRGDLHVRGRVDRDAVPITLEDAHGEVTFYPVPYVEPEGVRELVDLDDDAPLTHRGAVSVLLAQARRHAKEHEVRRSVVVAHGFVVGSAAPEESRRSERSLYLGGAGAIPASDFAGFDYVALGHLHRPQSLTPRVRYAGSLLKYSFDEVGHDKGLTLVDLGPDGSASIEHVTVTPKRDLATLSGALADLLSDPALTRAEACFVSVELTDHPPPLQAVERLRARFPHVAEVHYAARPAPEAVALSAREAPRDPVQVFADFAARVGGEAPDDEERALFIEALREVEGREGA